MKSPDYTSRALLSVRGYIAFLVDALIDTWDTEYGRHISPFQGLVLVWRQRWAAPIVIGRSPFQGYDCWE
jgi:hypothetical protein